ncbi:MAG: hypothetical protein HN368_13865, partial [Spirochaetales bacterium]|nr:hypothetical protein [Spirochaetales bacterium]
SILESFVIGAIILVLVQTFLEDYAILVGWTWNIRKVLVFTGFFFDLFFTIEFLSRLYSSVYSGRAGQYFFRERGWIDFLASIPLLLLSSGPAVLALLTGGSALFALGGILNVLKVIKAVKIARVLRLLRVLKIFKQIKYTDSVMAQRHVTKITSLIISLFVILLFIASVALTLLDVESIDSVFTKRNQITAEKIADGLPDEGRAARLFVEEMGEDVLLVKNGNKTIYSRYKNEFYAENYGPGDYQYVAVAGYDFFFDIKIMLVLQAKDSLIYFGILVLFVVFLLVTYSPHFALTITDPIHVMRKGIEDDAYNLEVKIPDKYRDDDIYKLADAFNRIYLPMKDRALGGAAESKPSLLNLDDVKDLLDTE